MNTALRLAAQLVSQFAATLVAGTAFAQPAAVRSVLPLREVVIRPVGTPRYAVTISVNGVPLEAGLDTGSVGLRLLPRAVVRAGVAAGPEPDRFSYGSGVELDGRRALAEVAIGAVRGRIAVQAVETVSCVNGRECPANRIPPAAYGLMGDGVPDQGFAAIVGVRLATRPTPNPLAALGVERWIVHLPQRGRSDGALILNPDARDLAGFTPLRPGEGAPGTVGGCVALAFPQARRICGPTLLDTGVTQITVKGAPRPPEWRPDQPARLDLVGAGGGAVSVAFRTGDAEHGSRSVFAANAEAGGRPEISAGALPFYAVDVLFDSEAQAIAVRPNSAAGAAVHPQG